MTRPEWLAVIARWPDEARTAWGVRSNALTPEGLVGWREAERLAFEEISRRMISGEFRESLPPQQQQQPIARTSRRAPAPGQAGLGFDHRRGA